MGSPLDYLHGLPSIMPLNVTTEPALAMWPTLNVLLPGVATKAMSGGPNTVVQISHRLAARGIPVRYISTDIPADTDHGPFWEHCASLTGVHDADLKVEVRCGFNRSRPMALGENDLFMASAWWNVQMIKRILPQMRTKRFFYLIQEFEPGLYPWSTEYALSQETYGFDFYGLLNEQFIAEYLSMNSIGRFANPSFLNDRCVVFEPAIDTTKFKTTVASPQRRKQLLFYARPETAKRNLFELGLYALNYAANIGVFDGEPWDFYFVGEKLPEAQLGGGITIKAMPWMSYSDYAKFVAESDIALSLMLSPHTSYLPLEMAAAGGFAVTSIFANKTSQKLAALSPNIIGVEPTLDGVVEGLKTAVARARDPLRNHGIHLPSTWDIALSELVSISADRFREAAYSPMVSR